MNGRRSVAGGFIAALTLVLLLGTAAPAAAQAKPEGEMRFAFYVTISPAWSRYGRPATVIAASPSTTWTRAS